MLQLLGDLLVARHAAVDADRERREVALELVDGGVAQRRHLAVFLGAQAFQPSVAGVHHEHLAAGLGHRADEVAHELVVLLAIDADAMLDRHRDADRVAHGLHAIGHRVWLAHQAGAEGPALHTLAGATAVEIDLVVAPAFGEPGPLRQVLRLAAAELQGHRVLLGVEIQMSRHVAVQQRPGGHHLGVEPRACAQQAVEVAAMAIGPVHHRGGTQAPWAKLSIHIGRAVNSPWPIGSARPRTNCPRGPNG